MRLSRHLRKTRRHEPDDAVARWAAVIEATADGILVVDRQARVQAVNEHFMAMWKLSDDRDDCRPFARPVAGRGPARARPQTGPGSLTHLDLLAPVLDELEDRDAFVARTRAIYADPDKASSDLVRFKDGRTFECSSAPQRVGEAIVGRVWTFRDVTVRERALRRAVFLADAARLLASLDLEQALDAVARLVVAHLGTGCTIRVKADRGPEHRIAVARDPARPPATDPHPGVLAGRSVIYDVAGVSHLGVPLEVRGKHVGAITLVGAAGRAYGPVERELAEELAGRIVQAIENARLYLQVQEALRARDEFLSIAAHEIRGPVNAIHLAVQSVSHGKVPPPALPRLFEVVQRQDRRLSQFVEELLDLGRIRSGRFQIDVEDVNLTEVVHDVVARLNLDLVRSGSVATITAPREVMGRWDRSRLDQVVSNLVSNAVKFGRGRPIEITVGERAGIARLVVRDHGVGMTREMLARMFEPFERGVSVRHYGGLGLGLYIVKTIVVALGGSVHGVSEPGDGAELTVELPCDDKRGDVDARADRRG